MSTVTLKGVYKIYPGDVQAVSDFNLDIEDKEFIVLVGPSGCGKTTTLRMVAGLEEISAGELYIGDRLMNDVPPKDRDIAMVFQNYALYPHMTVYDNMAFGLKLRKIPKAEIDRRVKEAARILDIEHLLERRPKALSGGQRQRVALGRAIVREPKVFLMDEPLSNLDAKLRVQMRTEITKLHQKLATTFIYVTHDQTEAMTMGSRIVVMRDGFVQQIDTPQHLYDEPVNHFVAGFIGTPPMNFFEVKLIKEDGVSYAVFGENKLEVPAERAARITSDEFYGKDLIMGIRPEDMHDEERFLREFPTFILNAYVEVVELMGSETYLYVLVSGKETNSTARVDARSLSRTGDTIKLAFDMRNAHFFDKETERSIFLP
ncbi:MAG: ABC transporter ATP-binding protein [Christensenellales bacterium]|jgi:multiple sugar transport system ATP-binding protein